MQHLHLDLFFDGAMLLFELGDVRLDRHQARLPVSVRREGVCPGPVTLSTVIKRLLFTATWEAFRGIKGPRRAVNAAVSTPVTARVLPLSKPRAIVAAGRRVRVRKTGF